MNKKGIVYLVGAGPGDPGLITVKGLECVENCDVLVYDRLASVRFLDYVKEGTELIYVGKKPDEHTLSQEGINQLLVDKALEGKNVTRLKGGDPFVFGRGGEEAELLRENDVYFEIVPGITSAVAVPAYAGIPVTHRDFTPGFSVITGHEDPGKEETAINWEKLSTAMGTLVFLMGVGNLPLITEKLIKYGRSSETPVALIRWGTRPEQKTLVGTLTNIAEKVKEANFKSPAIIIVGEVVKLREKLSWFENRPFFGKSFVVTRSRKQASVLSKKITHLGGEPLEVPAIDILHPESYKHLDEAITNLEGYDWLIFTSVNGVLYFFDRLKYHQKDIRSLGKARICAIGPKTKEALEEKSLLVDFVPSEYRAEAVIEILKDELKAGDKVLLPRADIARKILPETLAKLGAKVDNVVAYRTVMGEDKAEVLNEKLSNKEISVVTFTSSSTVRNFVKMIGEERSAEALEGVILASIGPITSEAARDLGLKIDIEATDYTIDGLVESIVKYYAGGGSSND